MHPVFGPDLSRWAFRVSTVAPRAVRIRPAYVRIHTLAETCNPKKINK
jgi:hypothetical protein